MALCGGADRQGHRSADLRLPLPSANEATVLPLHAPHTLASEIRSHRLNVTERERECESERISTLVLTFVPSFKCPLVSGISTGPRPGT